MKREGECSQPLRAADPSSLGLLGVKLGTCTKLAKTVQEPLVSCKTDVCAGGYGYRSSGDLAPCRLHACLLGNGPSSTIPLIISQSGASARELTACGFQPWWGLRVLL